jgi:endogenous inhibitor of DNA gyrase (YacG/DUF329 family)
VDRQQNSSSPTARLVRCPGCGGDSVYALANPFRPFCSQRCKNLDFGAWASESFRVASEAPPDDQPFGDAHLQ